MKTLTAPRMERCIGCHSCSLACARLVHRNLSWDRAGIRIRSSGGLSTGFEADTCLACDPAPCAEACPTCAYYQRKGGGVIVKKKLCIRCGECDKACPEQGHGKRYEQTSGGGLIYISTTPGVITGERANLVPVDDQDNACGNQEYAGKHITNTILCGHHGSDTMNYMNFFMKKHELMFILNNNHTFKLTR